MDDEERLRMSESGVDSDDYRRFLEQPSGNYDDSGYFSVQVISSALRVWGLELVPYNSTEQRAIEAHRNPEEMKAFICNYRDHWFTIRRLGYQWFNLNSLLCGPELISDTYLAMFLAQLQQEGYSIFVVFGEFPECEADSILRISPAVQARKPDFISVSKSSKLSTAGPQSLRQNSSTLGPQPSSVEDGDLQEALHLSLHSTRSLDEMARNKEEEEEMEQALRLSLTDINSEDSGLPIFIKPENSDDDLREALELSLQNDGYIDSEHADLEKAMKMSLECCEPGYVDQEEVRRKRLAYLTNRTDNIALPCIVSDASSLRSVNS